MHLTYQSKVFGTVQHQRFHRFCARHCGKSIDSERRIQEDFCFLLPISQKVHSRFKVDFLFSRLATAGISRLDGPVNEL